MEQCLPNDRVCLSLTWYTRLLPSSCRTARITMLSKSLYSLSICHKPIDLEATDLGPRDLCCLSKCLDMGPRWLHRQKCHKRSYAAMCERNESVGRKRPEMKSRCRTRWAADHCECYTRRMRLHLRLKDWMPKGINYCGACGKFTTRKRGHQGRCTQLPSSEPTFSGLEQLFADEVIVGYHGKRKERTSKPKFWTHTSRGGAFGRKIWKKWFNNRAMNRLERRLASQRAENERSGSQRYGLRKLEGVVVDTKKARDSKSMD